MRIPFTILICFCALNLFSQEILTLENIIKGTLEHNFSIRIERNNMEKVTNENNIGNAGYLPTIGVNAEQSWTVNNTRQQFFSGQVNEATNAKNQANNANIRLNWTFFDGFKMFASDQRLQLQEDLSILSLRAQMEMKIYQASVLYYTILQQQSILETYEQAVLLSKDRYKLTELKVKNGSQTQLQLIQARLDLTSDSANVLAIKKQLSDLKMDLNFLMGRTPNEPVVVNGTIGTATFQSLEDVMAKAKEQNTSLLMAKSAIAITEMQHKETRSLYFPQLSFFAQYGYTSSKNEVGILNSNRSFGPGVGFTFKWNILDRLSTYTAMKNSALQNENAILAEQEQNLFIETELQKVYTEYEWALQRLNLEEQNVMNVQETFSIAKKSFENGALTALELRTIQFAIVEAQSRILSAQLALKTAEMDLSLTTGNFKSLINE